MVVPLRDVVIARVVESEVGRDLQLGFVRGPAETAKPGPSRADDGLDRSRGDFRRPAPLGFRRAPLLAVVAAAPAGDGPGDRRDRNPGLHRHGTTHLLTRRTITLAAAPMRGAVQYLTRSRLRQGARLRVREGRPYAAYSHSSSWSDATSSAVPG